MKQLASFDVNEKRFTVLVPAEGDESLSIRSFGAGDKTVILGDIKLAEPVFKSPDHPKWYEICHYDPITESHKILARIQVDLIKDTVKPLDASTLPDVEGVECDKCHVKLDTLHHSVTLITDHLVNCGGKFQRK